MSVTENIVEFFYIVHGTIPELMRGVAYRRVKGTKMPERKTLKCPHCAQRLTDTESGTNVELYRNPARLSVSCQLYIKCSHCNNEVGIKIA